MSSATESERPGDGRGRQRPGERPGEAERDDQHRAEGGRRGRPEERGRRQRIAQQPLQGGAGEAERAADHQRQQGARQADFEHDDARRLAAPAHRHVAQRVERQDDRPDGQ